MGADRYRFSSPGIKVVAGDGSLEELSTEVAARGDRVALLVADALIAHTIARRAAAVLGVDPADVIEVPARPAPALIEPRARSAVRPLAVVGIGGGATLDAAKALAGRVAAAQLVVVPSTFAGASVTPAAALYEGDTLVRVPAPAPNVVILDPDVALTAPLTLAASSALVAAAHAIESTFVRTRGPISDALALAALERLAPAYAAMVADPASRDARAAMQDAAIMAGLAIRSARGGIQHAAAHALTIALGVPHAAAHAVLLPHTVALRPDRVAGALARVAAALQVADAARWARDAAARAGLQARLRDLGVERASLPSLVDRIAADRGRLDLDPRDPDHRAIRAILEEAW